jgi:peptidoglycan/LPS O-acetylase OafA/YrhL
MKTEKKHQAAMPLEKSFSVYLDLARFLAALLVVATHYQLKAVFHAPDGVVLPDLSREAVMVFFVLSGFVIAYSTEQKRHSPRAYIMARATRIYSVALPVLVLSYTVAAVALVGFGVHIHSAYQLHKLWLYLPLHLLFAGEWWTMAEIPPGLAPYWSLSYEVWYYVLFGVLYYLRGAVRIAVTAAILVLVGYKLWLLLPVWISGVYLYHWQKHHTLGQAAARLGWCVTLLLLAAFEATGTDAWLRTLGNELWPFPALRLGSADQYLADYVVCVLVFANFLCARFAGFGALARLANPVRSAAAYTFTLYLSHNLVITVWMARYPHDPGSLLDIVALSLLVLATTMLLYALSDARLDWLRAGVRRGTP